MLLYSRTNIYIARGMKKKIATCIADIIQSKDYLGRFLEFDSYLSSQNLADNERVIEIARQVLRNNNAIK